MQAGWQARGVDATAETRLQEMRRQLGSGDPALMEDALRGYQQAQADTRWGPANPYRELDDEVRGAARHFLRRGEYRWGALAVMGHLADAEDAELVAEVLERTDDAGVVWEALHAAGAALAAGTEPDARLLGVVGGIALDEGRETDLRECALRALSGLDGPEAVEVVLRAGESGDLAVQVCAAAYLSAPSRLPVHREHVRRLAESWPEDAGFWADQVREDLALYEAEPPTA